MPYYAGDPGLFSFVKKAVGSIGKVVGSPLGGLVTGLIPGGGFIKTGISLLGGLGGGGAAGGERHVTGGTPGAVAHGTGLVAKMRGRVRRLRRPRRRR